jgi:hypothetical protein
MRLRGSNSSSEPCDRPHQASILYHKAISSSSHGDSMDGIWATVFRTKPMKMNCYSNEKNSHQLDVQFYLQYVTLSREV